jgi:16S rRNA U1498 N3-methylase RsmE
MPKIRIYLDKEIIKDHKILLDLKHIHYLKNVMRKKSGDQILAFNSQSEWKCELKLGTENSMKPVKLLRQKILIISLKKFQK